MAEKQELGAAPAGIAGITRFDVDRSKFKVKPEYVVIMCLAFLVIEVALIIAF